MKIYGYSKFKVNENDLFELDEITFQADSSSLRAVANFLMEMAGRIEPIKMSLVMSTFKTSGKNGKMISQTS